LFCSLEKNETKIVSIKSKLLIVSCLTMADDHQDHNHAVYKKNLNK